MDVSSRGFSEMELRRFATNIDAILLAGRTAQIQRELMVWRDGSQGRAEIFALPIFLRLFAAISALVLRSLRMSVSSSLPVAATAVKSATMISAVGQPDMFDVITFNKRFLDLKVGLPGSRVL